MNIEQNIKLNRINDGKTDSAGNLWFGTMDNSDKKIENGSLYRLDKRLTISKVDTNYKTPNGPTFIDQYNFYHTDSSKKLIYKIRINKKDEIINKKIFKKFLLKDGSPDGMTLDKNKNLWVAHYNGACISVFNSKSSLIHRIKLPAKNITNCAFGGQNNNEVFVTTAIKGMSKTELIKFKCSGNLLSIKTNITGIKQRKFILDYAKKRPLLR